DKVPRGRAARRSGREGDLAARPEGAVGRRALPVRQVDVDGVVVDGEQVGADAGVFAGQVGHGHRTFTPWSAGRRRGDELSAASQASYARRLLSIACK